MNSNHIPILGIFYIEEPNNPIDQENLGAIFQEINSPKYAVFNGNKWGKNFHIQERKKHINDLDFCHLGHF